MTRGTHGDLPEEAHEQIAIEQADGMLILHLSGQFLGGEETDRLRGALQSTSSSTTKIILDLAGVSFVNSSFLSSLLSEHTFHRRHGREIRLAGLRPTVSKILELTHLSSVIPVFDDVPQAMR